TEKSGLYVNNEGRVQLARRATFPPGDAKEDWAILRALSEVARKQLPYDDLDGVRRALVADVPSFATRDQPAAQPGANPSIWYAIGVSGGVDAAVPLASPIDDFYLTNPIARASETMAECSRTFVNPSRLAAE